MKRETEESKSSNERVTLIPPGPYPTARQKQICTVHTRTTHRKMNAVRSPSHHPAK